MLPFIHVVSVPDIRGLVGEPVCCHYILLRGSVCSVLRKTQKLHHYSGQGDTDTVLCHYFHAWRQECKAGCCIVCGICLKQFVVYCEMCIHVVLPVHKM